MVFSWVVHMSSSPLRTTIILPSSTTNPFMTIHEITKGCNDHIKQFYWKLWYGDHETLPQIHLQGKFPGPNVIIEVSNIETFCSIVSNQGKGFKTVRNLSVQAPMDLAIIMGWQVCILYLSPHWHSWHFLSNHEIHFPFCY